MNQQQRHQMMSILKESLQELEYRIELRKGDVSFYWKRSDKNEPATEVFYKELNRTKARLKKLCEERATVVSLLKALKKPSEKKLSADIMTMCAFNAGIDIGYVSEETAEKLYYFGKNVEKYLKEIP